MNKQLFYLLLPILFLASCATADKEDPLKYTKKLVREGHVSLYNNGAFKVPNTQISLIPPGPGTIEFVGELAGIRARQSFQKAVQQAADSVYIVSEGTKLSFDVAKDIQAGSSNVADEIKGRAREESTLLVYRASETGGNVRGRSWELSKELWKERERIGSDVIQNAGKTAARIRETGAKQGERIAETSLESAKEMSDRSIERGTSSLSYARKSFVLGYAAVPSKMSRRAADIGETFNDAGFAKIIGEEFKKRNSGVKKGLDIIGDTINTYGDNVAESFNNARKELGDYRATGVSLAVLKSMRWVLQGILWDATIEPAANITSASVGYIGVNLVAFPTMVVVREGMATTNIAVEISWNTAKTGYDLVAPSATAAVAGVYGLADMAGSNLFAGTTAATGTVVGYSEKGGARAASIVIKGGGYAAGKGVQYIGVPLASAGIAVGGGTVGTAIEGSGWVGGGVVRVAGETGAITTRGFGNIIAGTTAVGGTAASVATGTASGVYELSKAVVVPTGYELGSGIVLSYGTLSHIGAHSILAVSDASYMVLSLEGPRWVIYAVKGKAGSGDDIPVGAVIDLKKMHGEGEEIIYLPVSNEEMKGVVDSVYENLPEVAQEGR